MTEVAAETLGFPIERVKFSLGDTRLPTAPVHGGSMTMASGGTAVRAERARESPMRILPKCASGGSDQAVYRFLLVAGIVMARDERRVFEAA
jgi:CO/xanthine dehydrogenase Mo-binding subunit